MKESNGIGQSFPSRDYWGDKALWTAFMAVAYFAAAQFSRVFLSGPEGMEAIWLPSGILLSALLLTRRSLRPHLTAALLLTNLLVELLAGTAPVVGVIHSLAVAGGAVLGAWLLLRILGAPPVFARVRDTLGFLGLAVVLGNGLTSLAAAAACGLLADAPSFARTWYWWTASTGVGSLLVTPFVLAWVQWWTTSRQTRSPQREWEGVASCVALALIEWIAFRYLGEYRVFALCLPCLTFLCLTWAAFRFGTPGVATALVILAGVAVPSVVAGRVPCFSYAPGPRDELITTHVFLAALAIFSLLLAAVIAGRRQAEEALRRSEERLRRAQRAARLGNWEWDLRTSELYWSQENYRLHGIDPEKVKPTYEAFIQLVDPAEREFVHRTVADALAGKRALEFDYTCIRPDNGERCIVHSRADVVLDGTGNVVKMVGTVQDVTAERRAEAALRESESRYRAIFEQTGDYVLVLELGPDGIPVIVDVNEAGLRAHGYSRAELLGKPISLLDPELTPEMNAERVRMARENRGLFTVRHRRKDGSSFDAEVRAQVIHLGERTLFLTAERDVTERLHAEEAIRELKRNDEQALKVAHMGHWEFDIATATFTFNDQYYALHGLTAEAAGGYRMSAEDFVRRYVHRDYAHQVQESVQMAMETDDPHFQTEFEGCILRADGAARAVTVWFRIEKDARGRTTKLHGVNQDITARKRAEDLLRHSEEKFRNLFNNALAGMFRTRLDGSQVLDVNEELLRIVGRTREEMLSQPSWIHWADPQERQEMVGRLAQEGHVTDFECRLRSKQGEVRTCLMSVRLYPEQGILEGSIRDITARKQMEERANAVQRRLESIFVNAPITMWLADEHGTLLMQNEMCRRLSHVGDAEVVGKYNLFKDNVIEDAGFMPLVRSVFEQGRTVTFVLDYPLAAVTHIAAPHGTRRILEVTIAPILGEEGKIQNAVVMHVNLTERRRAEETLRLSEARLKKAQEIAHLGSWELDLVTGNLVWSDEAYRIFGVAPESFAGSYQAFLEVVHPEDRAAVDAAYTKSLREDRNTYEIEHRIVRKGTGEVRHVQERCEHIRDAAGRAVRSVGMVHDISERKQMEEALRANEAKLETILDSSPCAIVVSDLEGRVVGTNTACLNMFGVRSKKEGLGRNIFEFVHPRDRDRARSDLAATLVDGLGKNIEYGLLRSDGSEFIGAVVSNLLRDAHGNPTGLVTVSSDITERKRSENLMRIQHDLAVSLGAVGELEEGLRLCLRAAFDASGLDGGGIYLYDPTSGGLDLRYHGGLSEDFVSRASHYGREDVHTQMVMNGTPLYATREELDASLDEAAAGEALRAFGVIPILHRGGVIGCLNVASRSLAEVPPHTRSVLETIASQIGGTIARLAAEEEVRRHRELLDRIADTSPAGITVMDRAGRLTFTNAKALEILGLAAEQAAERAYNAPAWCITDHEGRPFPEDQLPFRQVVNAGRPVYDVRCAIVRPDGRRVLLSSNAAPIWGHAGQVEGIVATVDDVTEQVLAARALRESEARYRSLVEESADAIGIFQEGRLVFINAAGAKLLGAESGDELLGRTREQVVHPDDLVVALDRIARRQQGERGLYPAEVRYLRLDGSFFPVEVNAAPILWSGKPALQFAARDITERKRAEKALLEQDRYIQTVLENAPIGFAVNTIHDSQALFATSKFEEIYGLARGSLHSVDEFFEKVYPDPVFREQIRARIMADVASGDAARMRWEDIPITTAAGEERFVTAINIPLFDQNLMVSTVQDVTARHLAEEALRLANQRMALHVEQTPLAVIEFDLAGRVREWNPAAVAIFGFSRAEAIGQYWHFIVPERVWGQLDGVWEALVSRRGGGRSTNENCTKDGRTIHCEWFNTPLVDSGGRAIGVASLVQDVTERKQAEETLRESEERFAQFMNHLPGVAFIKDAETRHLFVNRQFEELFHLAQDDWFERTNAELFPPSAAAALTVSDREVLAGTTPIQVEEAVRGNHWLTTKFPIRFRGGGVVLGGIAIDITKRKQVEAAMRESEARYRALFEQAGDYTLVLEPRPDGVPVIVDVNEAALVAHGYTREELIGKPISAVDIEPSRETGLERARKLQTEGQLILNVRHRRKDGSLFDVEARVKLVRIGRKEFFLSVERDVSERNLAEEKLRAYQRQLRGLASQLSLAEERERRRIATGLHDHACQTLVLSKMKLQRLQMSLPAGDQESISDICVNLDRTIESVREMTFDLSSPALYRFGLETALKELLEDKLKAEEGVRYVFHDDRVPKPVAEDVRIVLFQSVRELLTNTIKHARAQEVILDISRFHDSIRITVADDGIGFDVAHALAGPSGNQGFGLFSIRERLDFIGGTLDIESRPGQGSRFTLVAPLEIHTPIAKETHDGGQG